MGRFIQLGDLASTPQRLVFGPAVPDIAKNLKFDIDALNSVLDLIRVRTLVVMHQKAEPPVGDVTGNGEAVMAVSVAKEVQLESSGSRMIGTDLLYGSSEARRFTWEDVKLTCDLGSIQSAVRDIPHGLHDAKIWASVLDRFIKDQILIPTAWEQTMTFARGDIRGDIVVASPAFIPSIISDGVQYLGTEKFMFHAFLVKLFAEGVYQRAQAAYVTMRAGEEASSRIHHFPTAFGFDPLRYLAACEQIAGTTFVVARD